MAVLTGRAYWAKLITPDTAFNPDGVWSLDLALDEDMAARAKKLGLSLKNKDDDRGSFVTIKRKVVKANGERNDPPAVIDSEKNPVEDTLIGNGSHVNVVFRTFDWKYSTRSGVGADLEAVQIINLVEYKRGLDALPVVENGYVNESVNTTL